MRIFNCVKLMDNILKSLKLTVNQILDSERSDECIDFTAMCCFLWLSLPFRTIKMHIFSSTASIFSDRKANLVGALGQWWI